MARILLHAYNHHGQQLDITDICVLDYPYDEWAWSILKHRADGHEPNFSICDIKIKQAFDNIVSTYWESNRKQDQ